MAENPDQGAQDPEVAPQEPVTEQEPQGQEKDWVEKRLSQISAQKNEWKAKYEELLAQQQTPQAAPQGVADPAVDPDQQWVQDKMVPVIAPLIQQQDQRMANLEQMLLDQQEQVTFKARHPGVSEDMHQLIETQVSTLRQQNPGVPINRDVVYLWLKGQQAVEMEQAQTQQAVATTQAVQRASQIAQPATGTTPQPEPEPTFEDLSTQEQFELLNGAGAFKQAMYNPTGFDGVPEYGKWEGTLKKKK